MTAAVKSLAACFLIWSLAGAASEPIKLVGSEFNFGEVPQNATLTHAVWLHAGPKDSLKLLDIKTGCGCLVTSWKETILAPGDSLGLIFYWQTRASVGQSTASAYLYLTSAPYPLEVKLSGNVVTPDGPEASILVAPRRIAFENRPEADVKKTVKLTNNTSEELALTLAEIGPGIEVDVPEKVKAGGSVNLEVRKTDDGSAFESSFTIEAGGNPKAKQRVSVPVVSGDFSFRPEFTTTRK